MGASPRNGSDGDDGPRVWPTYPFATVWPPAEERPASAAHRELPPDRSPMLGVCCSGGGIRSAAFNLGSLQELWEAGELPRARYLAGVSGGSYIASAFALTARYSDPETMGPGKPGPYAPGSPEEQYLRNRCSYLAVGLGGKARLVGEVFVGVLANVALLAAFLWSLGRPLGWAYAYRNPALRVPACSASDAAARCEHTIARGWLIGPAAIAVVGLVLLGKAMWDAYQKARAVDAPRKRKATYGAQLMIGDDSIKFRTAVAFTLIGVALFVVLALAPPHVGWFRMTIAALAGAGLVTAVLGRILAMRSAARVRYGRVALVLLGAGVVAAIAYVAIPALILTLRDGHTLHLGRSPAGTTDQQTGASKLTWIGSITGGTAVVAIFTQVGAFFRRARTLVQTAEREASRLRKLNAKVRRALITVVGGLFGPVALVAGFLLVVNAAATHRVPTTRDVIGWAVVLAVAAWVVAHSDIVAWSMHPYYKRQLASAFVVKRAKEGSSVVAREIDSREVLKLSDLKREHMQIDFPELLVCAAANVSDGGATPPGTAVTSFVFSPSHVGGPLLGEMPTEMYEGELSPGARIHVSVPAAIAISGAALSPAMGKMTRPSARFLLALGNVRLGVWVPNPRRVERERDTHDAGNTFGSRNALFAAKAPPRYILNEVFGRHRIASRFVYLSDGGHYENLGLVELLRRGCTEIFCFDASGGHSHDNETLRQALALARSELGVEVDVTATFGEHEKEAGGVPATSCAAFDFKYPSVDGSPRVAGRIYYVRTEVSADDPWDVRAYTKADAEFPYHSTVDQMYTGERFEAYRVLGRSAARSMLAMRAQRDTSAPSPSVDVTEPEEEHGDVRV